MPDTDDIELLADYRATGSEAAFRTLVERHLNLVYSVALRHTGNAHHAEEITQAVFLILAKKGRALSSRAILSGWLYQTARLTAANFLRTEMRRARREQEAQMQSFLNEPPTDMAWQQIAPFLDEAMGRLGEQDRNAVLLRFFEVKSLGEVGAALGTNADAAKMRVNRALEKLRKFFTKRGVMLTTTLLAGAVSANSVQAAPLVLVTTVTAATAKGAAISASLTTLVKGTMTTMTWLKLKFAAGIGATALLVVGVATVAVSQPRSDGSSETLQVSGIITRTRPGEAPEQFCDFSAIIAGEKSLIRVQYFNGESFLCGTDGRDSFLLNEMKPARARDPQGHGIRIRF